jgi:hypothetical protein
VLRPNVSLREDFTQSMGTWQARRKRTSRAVCETGGIDFLLRFSYDRVIIGWMSV